MAAHLSALGGWVLPWLGQVLFPVLIWWIKHDDDDFVADQSTEAINFGITMALVDGVIWILLLSRGMELVFLLILATAFQTVFVIIGASRAHGGARYRYPLCLRLF